jgi:hypothetical protein
MVSSAEYFLYGFCVELNSSKLLADARWAGTLPSPSSAVFTAVDGAALALYSNSELSSMVLRSFSSSSALIGGKLNVALLRTRTSCPHTVNE